MAQGFNYPGYISTAQKAPSFENFYNYSPTAPLSQVQSPSYTPSAGQYTGLMGGDYDKLQQAIYNPQAQAAQTGYNQATANLQNTMGGRGMYGSSVMQNQQTQGLDQTYQNALQNAAANAAQQRYGLQSQEGQFGYQAGMTREQAQNQFALAQQQMAQQQNLNTYQANANEAARQMQYGEGSMNWAQQQRDLMRQWENQQNYEKNFQYPFQEQQAKNAWNENMINQGLAIAGQGAPLIGQQLAYQTAQQNMANQAAMNDQQVKAQSNLGWGQLAGSGIGGLMGGYSNWANLPSNAGTPTSIADYIKSWF
jgi:hypothetical protein